MNFSVIKIIIGILVLSTISMTNVMAGESKQTAYRMTSPCYTCLRLVRDPLGRINRLGNPIYQLEAYLKGQKIYSLEAVTGRAYTQRRNRHKAGTEAPLPDGNYRIDSRIVPGTIAEAGETFIPVYPNFATGRSALGIHYDPSFNQNNGEDGTSGCIALTNQADRDLINRFVRQYKPQELIVNIQ